MNEENRDDGIVASRPRSLVVLDKSPQIKSKLMIVSEGHVICNLFLGGDVSFKFGNKKCSLKDFEFGDGKILLENDDIQELSILLKTGDEPAIVIAEGDNTLGLILLDDMTYFDVNRTGAKRYTEFEDDTVLFHKNEWRLA